MNRQFCLRTTSFFFHYFRWPIHLFVLLCLLSFTNSSNPEKLENQFFLRAVTTLNYKVTKILSSTCSGNADAVVNTSVGITYNTGNANAVLGPSNNNFAQVYDAADRLVLDLTDALNSGETYTIRWRRKAANYGAGPIADIVIEESIDGTNWTENSFRPSTAQQTFLNTNVTTGVPTRYLRIRTETGVNDDVDIDAVSYADVGCGNPTRGNLTCSASLIEIRGVAFEDFDFDGVFDTGEDFLGIGGIQVRATDSLGTTFNTTTDGTGAYSFTGLIPTRTYRIEFTLPASLDWASTTMFNGDNGTKVQFVKAGNCANLGVASPADYCEDKNPPVVISCFETGNAVYGTTGNENYSIVDFPYISSGPTPTGINQVAQIFQTGSVWGVAWQASSRRLFSSTILKRHTGLGPLGTGGIYVSEFAENGGSSLVGSFNLNGVSPANGGPNINLGSVTRTGSAD
ncbi:MAG: SdrD B-like domain-containing protein, partial [Bacteroidota bacterium]